MGKIENNIIYHRVATEHGSSGAPILNLDTLKVIGIHLAYNTEENYNEGIILKESIKNFNKENKINLILKIMLN
jgi:V8-like Glu-specific endopeptidase